jgi:hypothetical protein
MNFGLIMVNRAGIMVRLSSAAIIMLNAIRVPIIAKLHNMAMARGKAPISPAARLVVIKGKNQWIFSGHE